MNSSNSMVVPFTGDIYRLNWVAVESTQQTVASVLVPIGWRWGPHTYDDYDHASYEIGDFRQREGNRFRTLRVAVLEGVDNLLYQERCEIERDMRQTCGSRLGCQISWKNSIGGSIGPLISTLKTLIILERSPDMEDYCEVIGAVRDEQIHCDIQEAKLMAMEKGLHELKLQIASIVGK